MMHTQLDAKLLRKLEHLMLMAKGVYSGEMMGSRRSRRRGSGLEFTDHKSYSPGDDLRYLDWNVLGRLDELFLKISSGPVCALGRAKRVLEFDYNFLLSESSDLNSKKSNLAFVLRESAAAGGVVQRRPKTAA